MKPKIDKLFENNARLDTRVIRAAEELKEVANLLHPCAVGAEYRLKSPFEVEIDYKLRNGKEA